MPDRLTLEATLVLITVALGLAFGAAVLVGGGASPTRPIAKRGPAIVRSMPGPAMDLGLTAARAVPALRASRRGPVQPRTPTRMAKRSAAPSLTLISAPIVPAETARPAPTAAPRQVTRRLPVAPAPTPKPEPTPIATPESSGDFDTTGQPAAVTPTPEPGRATAGVAK